MSLVLWIFNIFYLLCQNQTFFCVDFPYQHILYIVQYVEPLVVYALTREMFRVLFKEDRINVTLLERNMVRINQSIFLDMNWI